MTALSRRDGCDRHVAGRVVLLFSTPPIAVDKQTARSVLKIGCNRLDGFKPSTRTWSERVVPSRFRTISTPPPSTTRDGFKTVETNLTALSRQVHSGARMKSKRSVLEVLFPAVRAEIFRLLFASPTTEFYVRELRLKTDLALHTVQDELRKLSALGLVTSRSNGFHRFYQANRSHPLYRHIHAIVELSGKSPRTRHAALVRPPTRRPSSIRKRRPKRAHLRPDLPINWGTLQRRS